MAARYDYDIDNLDVVTAFFNGNLKEDIYLKQPEGFVDKNHRRKVCKLKKALYGLKQRAHAWNRKLHHTLVKFECSKTNPSLYLQKNKNESVLFLAVYVDDLLLFSNDHRMKRSIIEELERRFKMRNFGAMSKILGINVHRDRQAKEITLNQKNYLEDVLRRFNIENCNPVKTSLDIHQVLTKEMSPKSTVEKEEMRDIPYREAWGA